MGVIDGVCLKTGGILACLTIPTQVHNKTFQSVPHFLSLFIFILNVHLLNLGAMKQRRSNRREPRQGCCQLTEEPEKRGLGRRFRGLAQDEGPLPIAFLAASLNVQEMHTFGGRRGDGRGTVCSCAFKFNWMISIQKFSLPARLTQGFSLWRILAPCL